MTQPHGFIRDRYQARLAPPPQEPIERVRALLVNLGHTDERLCEAMQHMKANGVASSFAMVEIGAIEAYLVLLHRAACRLAEDAAGQKGAEPPDFLPDNTSQIFPR